MLIRSLILASATTLILGGAAFAQDKAYDPNRSATSPLAVNPWPAQSPPGALSADTGATVNTSATIPEFLPPETIVMPAMVVTNGPVPDTPENRARYGQPDSRTGKMTRPAGN